jgi:hypothetical protein
MGLKAARAYKPFAPAELSSVMEKGKTLAAAWGPLRGPVA